MTSFEKLAKKKKPDVKDQPLFEMKKSKQEELEVTGISRSGRVRKKSSMLADFESPDEIDPRYKRKVDRIREREMKMAALNLPPPMASPPRLKLERENLKMKIKLDPAEESGLMDSYEEVEESYVEMPEGDSEAESAGVFYPIASGIEENEEELAEEVEDEEEMETGIDDEEEEISLDALGIEELDDDAEDSLIVDTSAGEGSSSQRGHVKKSCLTSQAHSVYFTEKSAKKQQIIMKGGKPIVRVKAQRKDKGKSRFTAYMLWAKKMRQEIVDMNPDMDFVAISKRLGELWGMVPHLEKYNWKRRARRLAVKGTLSNFISTGNSRPNAPPSQVSSSKVSHLSRGASMGINVAGPSTSSASSFVAIPSSPISSPSQMIMSPSSPLKAVKIKIEPGTENSMTLSPPVPVNPGRPSVSKVGGNVRSGLMVAEPVVGPGLYKVVGTQPIDVAAHLKLLGESLAIIGQRLKEHDGQIAVSGSLSVLLDSLLCAMGPLLCLTQQVPETNVLSQETVSKILDNIAYIMPGL